MAVLRYTLLRLLIFAVVAALFWLVGFRGYVLLLSAVFVSGVVSIVVLRRSRDEVSATLDTRLSTIKERLEARTEAENAWNEAERAEQHGAKPEPESEPEHVAEDEQEAEPHGAASPADGAASPADSAASPADGGRPSTAGRER